MPAKQYVPSAGVALVTPLVELEAPPPAVTVFDADLSARPLAQFEEAALGQNYPEWQSGATSEHRDFSVAPEGFNEDYLSPTLTRNEYLRLTMLWYYTHDLLKDKDLLASLQSKVNLLCQLVGWEIGICGLLGSDTYRRVATSGVALALLSRRESTCSHTVLSADENHVMAVSDMSKDWRFRASPHVDKGGLRSYAGTPLRCHVDGGEAVALGSVCVASEVAGKTLTASQRDVLVRFADMMMAEIINTARLRRREQQQRMGELLAKLDSLTDSNDLEAGVFRVLTQIYPNAQVSVANVSSGCLSLSPTISITLDQVTKGLWEDVDVINSLIESSNHEALKIDRPVRAIVGRFWSHPTLQALVVASEDVYLVFDDIDAWFVDRCSAHISNAVQQRALKEARQVKERFLRGITHQLRTPLHGVLGSVDILAEELHLEKALINTPGRAIHRAPATEASSGAGPDSSHVNTADVLRTIRNSGRELMMTVNNMIKLDKWAELFEASDTTTAHDLSSLEDILVEDARRMLPDVEVDRVCVFFDNRLSPDFNATMLDANLIKECLQSLLLNALQYTTRGCVVISANASSDQASIYFDVQDTGCGIHEDHVKTIFEPYEKEDAHSRGAGLGLTLSSKIAAAMGGKVELVSSDAERGSLFRLSFPNPRLLYSTRFLPSPSTRIPDLKIKKFRTIPASPLTYTAQTFSSFLSRQGLEPTDESEGALTYLSYIPVSAMFAESLELAKKLTSPVVCLVPVTEDLETLRVQNPNIIFSTGPFTSKRLRTILIKLNELAYFESGNIEPLTPSVQNMEQLADLTLTASPRLPMQHRPNTLLVDDNTINLRIIRMYCEKRSLPHVTAIDGLEAIAAYKAASASSSPIDLILLDLQMPNCDGIGACHAIRQLEKEQARKPCIIFIITGQDSPKDKDRAFAAGADEYYIKPMGIKAIDAAIARYFTITTPYPTS